MQPFHVSLVCLDRCLGRIALGIGRSKRRLGGFEFVATLIKYLLRQPPFPYQGFSALKIPFGGGQIAFALGYQRDGCCKVLFGFENLLLRPAKLRFGFW